MKVLITVTAKHPVPPEQMPGLIQAFIDWRARYRDRFESFYFWAAGGGGGGVIKADDEATLHRMMLEFPFSFFSDITAQPIVDGDVALQTFQAAVQQMMAGPGGR
jgi:hypothetical protein